MNFLETFYLLCISSFCINFGRIFYGATWNKTAQIKLFVSFCYYFFFSFIFIQHIRICIRYTHLHSIHITTHDTLKIYTYIKNYQFITYTFVHLYNNIENKKIRKKMDQYWSWECNLIYLYNKDITELVMIGLWLCKFFLFKFTRIPRYINVLK